MKTNSTFFLIISLLFSLFFASCGTKETEAENDKTNQTELQTLGNSTLDELGVSVIFLLKENDFEKFTEFLPYKTDVEKFVLNYSGPNDKRESLILSMNENVKNIRINSKCGFDEVFNQGLKMGIDWQYAKFKQVEYVLTRKDNIESGSVNIMFLFEKVEYHIIIKECVHSERGWLIFNKLEWPVG